MTGRSVYITGMGVISAIGCGLDATIESIDNGFCGLKPLRLFPVPSEFAQPVGMAELEAMPDESPRTHRLACLAADQALAACHSPPDAIVLGTTTGGMLSTETHFLEKLADPSLYDKHALGSVGQVLARNCGCTGPVLTVSTACSSGAVAIAIAVEMLRSGMFERILAGGADSLCRLTYFGFNSLKLVDPTGSRPLDRQRGGLSVAEGAGLVLLTNKWSPSCRLQLCGTGMSCDAYHATAPHPEGAGALEAMQWALKDAGLVPSDIDYINLHGTGTLNNDRSEAKAIRTLFGANLPPISSTKGATGHTLAAAGAIEAVISGACIEQGIVPANAGYRNFDEAVDIVPVLSARRMPVSKVMSNSLGFGGNNAVLIIGEACDEPESEINDSILPLTISAWACLTGAGHTAETWSALQSGTLAGGLLDDDTLSTGLPPRTIRRLKRLPKIALALADRICKTVSDAQMPTMVSMGTAWGALSETHDFLRGLIQTDFRYPSPTDFIGSVHNAPAGQIAMLLGAKGANVTTSGGDCTFEQALLCADMMTRRSSESVLVVGADEYHAVFSPLFDSAVRNGQNASDGGGGLLLKRSEGSDEPTIAMVHYQSAENRQSIATLVERLGGVDGIARQIGAFLVGIPAGCRSIAEDQLDRFSTASRFSGPLIDYRRLTGEVASASAIAAVLAVQMVVAGTVPGALVGGGDYKLCGKGVAVLGLGDFLTAMRISPP